MELETFSPFQRAVGDGPARAPKAPRRKLRFVVIDDDPVFGDMIEHVALRHGMLAHAYASLDEAELPELLAADVIILDYNLGATSGLELGKLLKAKNVPAPILLISAGQEAFKQEDWPDNIRGFTSKMLGPFGVLDSILQVVESEPTLAHYKRPKATPA